MARAQQRIHEQAQYTSKQCKFHKEVICGNIIEVFCSLTWHIILSSQRLKGKSKRAQSTRSSQFTFYGLVNSLGFSQTHSLRPCAKAAFRFSASCAS